MKYHSWVEVGAGEFERFALRSAKTWVEPERCSCGEKTTQLIPTRCVEPWRHWRTPKRK